MNDQTYPDIGKMAIKTVTKGRSTRYVVGFAHIDGRFIVMRMTPERVIGPDGTIPMVYKTMAQAQGLIDYMKSVMPYLK